MEDISRELEKEIARAKPSPYKAGKNKRILIIDDFGELSSGGYLKVLVYVFFVISLAGALGTCVFYFLSASAQRENIGLKEQLVTLRKKADRLTKDKEILMARLVMAGKKPDLASPVKKNVQTIPAKDKQIPMSNPLEIKTNRQTKEKAVDPIPITTEASVSLPEGVSDDTVPPSKPMVSVEKFSVVQGKTRDELIVRFNIRNVSTEAKEISGRIFAVLKPGTRGESDWMVVPKGIMENGLPGPYHKGQYFSISRFKPVKFTIRNQASPDSFAIATVYIFGEQGKLLFENTIQINGG